MTFLIMLGLDLGLEFLRIIDFCEVRRMIFEIMEEWLILILLRIPPVIGCIIFLLFLMSIVAWDGHH